jgi:hypothetical protein
MLPKLEKLPSKFQSFLAWPRLLNFSHISPTVPKCSYTPNTVYLNPQAQAARLQNEGSSQECTMKNENAENDLCPRYSHPLTPSSEQSYINIVAIASKAPSCYQKPTKSFPTSNQGEEKTKSVGRRTKCCRAKSCIVGSDRVPQYTAHEDLADIDVLSFHRRRCRRNEPQGPRRTYRYSSFSYIRTFCLSRKGFASLNCSS